MKNGRTVVYFCVYVLAGFDAGNVAGLLWCHRDTVIDCMWRCFLYSLKWKLFHA